MDAKQCDRCGSFYAKDVCDPHFVIGKQTRKLNYNSGVFEPSTKGLDICPECQAAFECWVNDPSKVELSDSVAEDIKKLNDSLDFKDKWIHSLKEENKSLLMLRNQMSEQLLLARREIESLKEELGRIRND